jgi:V8-like Glu-specific endopeptidase
MDDVGIYYDIKTKSGQSGSPVYDLKTKNIVVGIHKSHIPHKNLNYNRKVL